MLLGLACVFLKHGAEPEELELISDPAFLENKQDIDWLIADESCAEGIWPVTGKAFVIGDRTEKNRDIMYLRKGLTAEELYQEMVTKLTVRGMSEDDMQDESRSFDFEMDDIPEENIESRLYLSYSPVGGCGKTLGSLQTFCTAGKTGSLSESGAESGFCILFEEQRGCICRFCGCRVHSESRSG